jgi:hypothetical protein
LSEVTGEIFSEKGMKIDREERKEGKREKINFVLDLAHFAAQPLPSKSVAEHDITSMK